MWPSGCGEVDYSSSLGRISTIRGLCGRSAESTALSRRSADFSQSRHVIHHTERRGSWTTDTQHLSDRLYWLAVAAHYRRPSVCVQCSTVHAGQELPSPRRSDYRNLSRRGGASLAAAATVRSYRIALHCRVRGPCVHGEVSGEFGDFGESARGSRLRLGGAMPGRAPFPSCYCMQSLSMGVYARKTDLDRGMEPSSC